LGPTEVYALRAARQSGERYSPRQRYPPILIRAQGLLLLFEEGRASG
jgi:hypothetical protein